MRHESEEQMVIAKNKQLKQTLSKLEMELKTLKELMLEKSKQG